MAMTGRHHMELRMDEHGITVKNTWRANGDKRVVGWDEVRWLRDCARVTSRTRWVLEIVLKSGVLVAEASKSGTAVADPQTLEAIRRAARARGIPAVLTGRPVGRFLPAERMPKAGLYPDPGDEPGLREWDGTEWSPVLHTDHPADAAPDAAGELTTVWSPLPKQVQQRHSESATSALASARFNAGALVVLTPLMAAGLVAGLVVGCYWLASPSPGVSVAARAWVWVANVLLAVYTAGLARRGIRAARRSVVRHERIAEAAREAAARASAHDVQSRPETTWTVTGKKTELRLDDHEITVRTGSQTRWIAWNDVRWFRDGTHFHLSGRLRNDGWALAIVLKDGSVVIPGATKKRRGESQQILTAVRQAARHHAIPAVLTGRRVRDKPSPADKPGLYPDPGGEPGLREWTGTEWLPTLLVAPATMGQPHENGQASIVSPLSSEEQQRQWDAAIAAVPRWRVVVGQVLGLAALVAACDVVAPPIIVIVRAVEHGFLLGLSPVAAVALYAAAFVCTCGWCAVSLLPVRNRRITQKIARAARAAAARAAEPTTPSQQRV
jgi:hypothetical protein